VWLETQLRNISWSQRPTQRTSINWKTSTSTNVSRCCDTSSKRTHDMKSGARWNSTWNHRCLMPSSCTKCIYTWFVPSRTQTICSFWTGFAGLICDFIDSDTWKDKSFLNESHPSMLAILTCKTKKNKMSIIISIKITISYRWQTAQCTASGQTCCKQRWTLSVW